MAQLLQKVHLRIASSNLAKASRNLGQTDANEEMSPI